jgi:HD-GYP domain-containing protein (c-di-GMP phosphodiesterase class II)
VREKLLEDRYDHVIERDAEDIMPSDNKWGFKIRMPERKYNLGEIYNLCIGRGTLNDEERYKINDHIMQTIVMLEGLPFPRHLRRVAEYAGGHHEKMDGTGYPRGLKRADMSIPARVMAIADIFEALTAADRPYKPAKKLSESIKIMSFMVKDNHIDPDIFRLFLESRVYREYAEKFLKPEQIDEVDVAAYLR